MQQKKIKMVQENNKISGSGQLNDGARKKYKTRHQKSAFISIFFLSFFVKMSQFIIEDGKGEMLNENGNKVSVLPMEVDDPNFPLGDVTNYSEYHDLKPSEKL